VEPSLNMHLIWDETEIYDIDDDIMEEACVGNDYNLRSKGAPKTNYSPSTSKMIVATPAERSSEQTKDTR
jgi:hypothetical protein